MPRLAYSHRLVLLASNPSVFPSLNGLPLPRALGLLIDANLQSLRERSRRRLPLRAPTRALSPHLRGSVFARRPVPLLLQKWIFKGWIVKNSLLALTIIATATLSFSAQAGMNGLTVSADLAFGPNGAYRTTDSGYPYWGTSKVVGQNSLWTYEQNFAGPLQYQAYLDDSSLTIFGNINLNSNAYPNGFEMIFSTPAGFNEVTLTSSSFSPNLTYKLKTGTIVVDWLGPGSPIDPQSFKAVFAITAVPEPQAITLCLFGLLGYSGMQSFKRRTKI